MWNYKTKFFKALKKYSVLFISGYFIRNLFSGLVRLIMIFNYFFTALKLKRDDLF